MRVADILTTAGVTADLCVAVGGVVETATEIARQDNVDLMIIGRGTVSEALGRLRTHAFGLIQHSPCPVLSV